MSVLAEVVLVAWHYVPPEQCTVRITCPRGVTAAVGVIAAAIRPWRNSLQAGPHPDKLSGRHNVE